MLYTYASKCLSICIYSLQVVLMFFVTMFEKHLIPFMISSFDYLFLVLNVIVFFIANVSFMYNAG